MNIEFEKQLTESEYNDKKNLIEKIRKVNNKKDIHELLKVKKYLKFLNDSEVIKEAIRVDLECMDFISVELKKLFQKRNSGRNKMKISELTEKNLKEFNKKNKTLDK